VPDAWDIFHPDDAVARAGKFFVLYKRAAHTVIISAAGELVVRPSYAEQSVRRGFSPRLAEHLLSRYANSLGAILKAAIDQGGKKHTPNEPMPIIQNEALGDGDGEYAEATVRSIHEALKELLARDYIQEWLRFTNAIRQDSLLRIMGATSSRIEQARLQIIEDDEAAHGAQKTRKGLNCGTCMSEGMVLNWLNDPKSLVKSKDKDAELHVQD
jgi:hypothetical protein